MLVFLFWIQFALQVSSLPQYSYPKPTNGNQYTKTKSSTSLKDSTFDKPPSYQFIENFNTPSSYLPSGNHPEPTYGIPDSYFRRPPPPMEYSTNNLYHEGPVEPAVIHKHITVHIPPEAEPPGYPPAEKKKPEKHYKIVFIRAPTVSPRPTAPPPPPKEEKTLIYVLVKKPEEELHQNVPEIAPTVPSKPEVFFIQYKSLLDQKGGEGGHPTGYSVHEESELEDGHLPEDLLGSISYGS